MVMKIAPESNGGQFYVGKSIRKMYFGHVFLAKTNDLLWLAAVVLLSPYF